jgi:hypothetical protein
VVILIAASAICSQSLWNALRLAIQREIIGDFFFGFFDLSVLVSRHRLFAHDPQVRHLVIGIADDRAAGAASR